LNSISAQIPAIQIPAIQIPEPQDFYRSVVVPFLQQSPQERLRLDDTMLRILADSSSMLQRESWEEFRIFEPLLRRADPNTAYPAPPPGEEHPWPPRSTPTLTPEPIDFVPRLPGDQPRPGAGPIVFDQSAVNRDLNNRQERDQNGSNNQEPRGQNGFNQDRDVD